MNRLPIIRLRSLLAFLVFMSSILLILPSSPAFATGSGVKVAIMEWTVNAPPEQGYLKGALTDMISTRIGANEYLEVIRKDEVSKETAALSSKQISASSALAVGKNLEADYVLYGSLSMLGDSVSLDVSLVNVSSGSTTPFFESGVGLPSIVKLTDNLSARALKVISTETGAFKPDLTYTGKFSGVSEIKPATKPKKIVPVAKAVQKTSVEQTGGVKIITRKQGKGALKQRSLKLKGVYVSMTHADLNGDGRDEFFLLSASKLTIVDYDSTGMVILKEIKAPADMQNLAISSGDTDGDGVVEVYLSRVNASGPDSVLVEYRDGEYAINEQPGLEKYLVRVINVQGEGVKLIAQGYRFDTGFKREIIELTKGDGSYEEAGLFELPQSVVKLGLYGFQVFDIDKDGTNEVVTLGRGSNIRIYKKAVVGFDLYWRSSEEYGGSLNEIERPETPGEDFSIAQDSYYVMTSLKYGDFNADGVTEIIIKKNNTSLFGKYAKRIRFYKSGSLSMLSWNVALMDEQWKTSDISGYVADFSIGDVDRDGVKDITMLIVEGMESMLKSHGGKSYLLTHSIR